MTSKPRMNKDKRQQSGTPVIALAPLRDNYSMYTDEHARLVAAQAAGERLAAETLARIEKKLASITKPTRQKLQPKTAGHRTAGGTSTNGAHARR